jgi:ribulose-phosphate 3-epimerase
MFSNNSIPDFQLSISAISTKPQIFFDSIKKLEELSVSRIHVDIMDGQFVPRLGLYPEFIENIRELTSLPIDVHLMTRNPERLITVLSNAGASRITPHVESSIQTNQLISQIRDSGTEAGLAINPATDLASLRYLLPDISVLTMMAINPGIKGHAFIQTTFTRIRDFLILREDINPKCDLEIDGGVLFSNIKELKSVGANIAVCGAGTIFHPGGSIEDNFQKIQTNLR